MTHAAFNLAFDEWMRADLDRHLALWDRPVYASSGVTLTLRRFSRHYAVTAHISRSHAVLHVEWDYESWGELAAFDVDAVRDEHGGWRCALNGDDQLVAVTVDMFWRDHLFEPLRDWVERRLQTGEVLYLHEQQRHRWSTLASRGTPSPATARLAVYAEILASPAPPPL